MSKKIKLFLSAFAVLMWMSGIFYFSSQPAGQSRELSQGVTDQVIETIERVSPESILDKAEWHRLIRKCAHFFLYFVLGVLTYCFYTHFRMSRLRTFNYSFFTSLLYAISDEWHQYFVPGRGAQVTDVLIDSAGALTGIVFIMLVLKLRDLKQREMIL